MQQIIKLILLLERVGIRDFLRQKIKGSAMILTMFILSGMLIIAMSGAYVVLLGIISSGTQAQSTRAYFAAEAGIERLLWDIRVEGLNPEPTTEESLILSGDLQLLSSDDTYPTYDVFYLYSAPDRFFTSVGESQNIKRSVEVKF